MAVKTWSLTTPADDILKNAMPASSRDIKEHAFMSSGFYAEQISTPDQTIAIYAGIFYVGSDKIEYPGLDVVDLGTSGAFEVSAMTADYYNKILFSLDSFGTLVATEGTAHAVLATVTEPILPRGHFPICEVSVQDDGTGTVGTILTIEQSEIEQLQRSLSVSDGGYSPYYGATDQGVTGSNNTLKYYVDTIGSDISTMIVRNNSGSATTTYTLTTPETISTNITLEIEPGGMIDGAGTLTFDYNDISFPSRQVFGASLTILGSFKVKYIIPNWFGPMGDGTDTATMQKAIDFIQASSTDNNNVIQCLNSLITLDSKLTFKDHSGTFVRFPITFKGTRGQREGSGTLIQAAAGFSDDQMFEFLDTAGAGANAYYTFMDFKIDGNSIAGLDGFDIETAASFEFIRVSAGNVLGDVFALNEGTEITIFDTCRVISCGNGITFDEVGQYTNDLRIINSEFSSNSGWAIHGRNVTGLTITGNTFQSCAKGVIYLEGARSFVINGSNRFESNGLTGHAYTTPATGTINADIHLNGVSDDDVVLATATPCEAGDISTNIFTGSSGYNIYANALVNTTIKNNLAESDIIIGSWGDTDYTLLKSLEIKDNQNYENSPTVNPASEIQEITFEATFAANNLKNPANNHTIDFGIEAKNYLINQTMNQWTDIVADGGGTFLNVGGYVDNTPVFRLTNNGSASDTFGIDVDLVELFPITRSKWVWFGAWVTLSSVTNTNAALYMEFTTGTGVRYSTAETTGDSTDRVFISMAQEVPAGATAIQIGIKKLGTGTGTVTIEKPILALTGSPYNKIPTEDKNVFYGTAAPTVGVWPLGPVIYDITPSAGGFRGWIITTPGTPGTWKTFGAISA